MEKRCGIKPRILQKTFGFIVLLVLCASCNNIVLFAITVVGIKSIISIVKIVYKLAPKDTLHCPTFFYVLFNTSYSAYNFILNIKINLIIFTSAYCKITNMIFVKNTTLINLKYHLKILIPSFWCCWIRNQISLNSWLEFY